MPGPQSTIRVIVSYAQEAQEHRDRCRELADRLRGDGVEAWIDQYVPAPPEGWPRWMQQQITASTSVILVCTPTFRRRFEGMEEPGVGHGATWEGMIATQMLYDNGSRNEKLVPVLFDDVTAEAVPTLLRPFTRYTLWRDYLGLYRHLTAQPATVPPPVALRKVMPPLSRTTAAPQTAIGATVGSSSAMPMRPGAELGLQAVSRPAEPAPAAQIAALDEFCTRCSVRPGTHPRSCSSIRGHQFTQAPHYAYCRVCGCVPGGIAQSCVGGRDGHAFASADALPRCSFCGHEAGTRTTCRGLRSTHEFMA